MVYDSKSIDTPLFRLVGEAADEIGQSCHVVGGYVRDLLLHRPSKDIDFTTEGSGWELAKAVARRMGRHTRAREFAAFKTAQVTAGDVELEFVGARRESYRRGSRKPVVEDGTFDDDISRRDFTINAMAIRVNADGFGTLVDRFDGLGDLERKVIRTPLDPDVAFADDPLRMLRAVRFATQLGFEIAPGTLDSITRNAALVKTLSGERIKDELAKIMKAPKPSTGWWLMLRTGLLGQIIPELAALHGVEEMNGRGHKENFDHTMQVLDRVAAASADEWLRWGALLHDVGKPVTKKWDAAHGWTFHNHNFIGAKMVPRIFKRLKMPLNADMKKVEALVELHMRPVALVEDNVTDSAVRRLGTDAGEYLDDLMTLCEADITSRNPEKVRRCLANLALVRQKIAELSERDYLREYNPPVDGRVIGRVLGQTVGGIEFGKTIKAIKNMLKEAWIDGKVTGDYMENFDYFIRVIVPELNLTVVDDNPLPGPQKLSVKDKG